MIRRTGSGEFPLTAVPTGLVPLPHPATFNTVTLMLPALSTALINTCRKPTKVTLVWVPEATVAPASSKIGRETYGRADTNVCAGRQTCGDHRTGGARKDLEWISRWPHERIQ